MSGVAADLLEFIEDEYALQVAHMRVLNMSPWLFDQLYRYKSGLLPDSGWLNHEIAQAAPAAAVLMRGTVDGSLSSWLYHIKGESEGLVVDAPGTLRARGKRPSSLHKVVYASEHTGAMLAESLFFFQWSELREALDLQPQALDRSARRRLLEFGQRRDQSVFECLCEVKQRALASLVLDGLEDTRVEQLRELLYETEMELEAQPLSAQAEVFAQLVESERETLTALVQVAEAALQANPYASQSLQDRWLARESDNKRMELLNACWLLSGQEGYFMDDGSRLFDALERGGVPLSRWQRTLIRAGIWSDANPDLRAH